MKISSWILTWPQSSIVPCGCSMECSLFILIASLSLPSTGIGFFIELIYVSIFFIYSPWVKRVSWENKVSNFSSRIFQTRRNNSFFSYGLELIYCMKIFRRRCWSFFSLKLSSLPLLSSSRCMLSTPPQGDLTSLTFYVLSLTLECILLYWPSWYFTIQPIP